jgi:Ca-activated chloride channel family protein
MRFLQPHYLFLALLLLVLLPLSYFRLRRTLRIRRALSGPLRQMSSLSSAAGEVAIFLLSGATLAALILALAQPQWIRSIVIPEFKTMDFVFLVDTSPSMRAEDISPSRLDRALDVIAAFSDHKEPQDRIGLVAFAGRSVVLSYLTEDPSNVRYYLDYLRRDRVPRLGTNIGRALNNGMTVLTKEREVNPAAINNKGVFILISDGEDHGAELAEAVNKIRTSHVKVHTIAIGSTGGAPIPIAWEDGKPQYLVDNDGARIISHLDESSLRWLAQETGGGSYRAITGDELPNTLTRIIETEREIQGFQHVVQYRDLHMALLLSAFAMFLTIIVIRGARA